MKRYLFICVFFILSFHSPLFAQLFVPYLNINMEGFGEYELRGKSFFLVPADETISMKDLEFREYSKDVSALLQYEGAIEAEDITNADMCILVSYSISEKAFVETVPVPIRGIVGSKTTTTTSTNTLTDSYGSIYGSIYGYGDTVYGDAFGSVSTNQNRNTNTQSSTSYDYGVVGHTMESQTITKYVRALGLYAYDNRITREPVMLWKATVVSAGSGSSLRTVMPFLCFAATDYNLGKGLSFSGDLGEYEDYDYFKLAIKNLGNTTFVKQKTSDSITLRYIIREQDCISLFYRISRKKSGKLSKKMALMANGKTYPLIKVDDGKIIRTLSSPFNRSRVFKLSFESIPSDCNSISVINCEGFNFDEIELKPSDGEPIVSFSRSE